MLLRGWTHFRPLLTTHAEYYVPIPYVSTAKLFTGVQKAITYLVVPRVLKLFQSGCAAGCEARLASPSVHDSTMGFALGSGLPNLGQRPNRGHSPTVLLSANGEASLASHPAA